MRTPNALSWVTRGLGIFVVALIGIVGGIAVLIYGVAIVIPLLGDLLLLIPLLAAMALAAAVVGAVAWCLLRILRIVCPPLARRIERQMECERQRTVDIGVVATVAAPRSTATPPQPPFQLRCNPDGTWGVLTAKGRPMNNNPLPTQEAAQKLLDALTVSASAAQAARARKQASGRE